MAAVTLHRTRYTSEGTFGVLYIDARPAVVTCEDPWQKNAKNKSCIPTGRYRVVPRFSVRHKDHWHVLNVPNRDLILIHTGNTINDTEGCILPGMEFGEVGGLPAVQRSREAMLKLRGLLPKEFWLSVIDGMPE